MYLPASSYGSPIPLLLNFSNVSFELLLLLIVIPLIAPTWNLSFPMKVHINSYFIEVCYELLLKTYSLFDSFCYHHPPQEELLTKTSHFSVYNTLSSTIIILLLSSDIHFFCKSLTVQLSNQWILETSLSLALTCLHILFCSIFN